MAESIVESVVFWIGSALIQEANILFEVADQVQDLQRELILMQQYLKDADAKQEVGEIRFLIDQIRQHAYDAEDVIDTYILKFPAPAKHRIVRFGKWVYNAPDSYKVGKKIQAIQCKVKQTIEKLNGCGVRRIVPELREGFRKLHKEGCWRVQIPSYPFEDRDSEYVVGLENEISKLLEVLMGEENSHINVISIVGMGGCGKTTVARKLYNHPYVKECFNCMAWVFISQEWSTRHIISEILRKVGGPKETSELHTRLNEEELVDKLRNILKEKLYLVVLDDVWQREALKDILPAFPGGMSNRGSKIVITTRNAEINQFQNLQQHIYIHEPQPLSEIESWELFSRISLSHRTDCALESFVSLAKEMLRKCGGLPLAIVALAGILNPRDSIGQWQQVNEAVRSRIMEDKGTNIQSLLALSYDDLPDYLKPCFLFLGLFPEDCQIPAGMLIRMWIAEGFVAKHEDMSPEDVGMQLLKELSQRFMIKVVSTNLNKAIKAIQLHDLLRDLCLRKAEEQSFLQICTAADDQAYASGSEIAIPLRRVALHSSFSLPTQASSLRSLLLMTRSTTLDFAYVSKETIDIGIVHRKFKLLRMLNLWGVKTSTGTLPSEIGSLIHLRYLSVRASNITEFPTSIGKLRNLLTLDYRNIISSDSDAPLKMPNALSSLMQLRHLFLPIEFKWGAMDLQLSTMKNLQVLWGVKQNFGDNWLLRELPRLSSTVRKLKIVVSTEEELKAAFICPSFMSDGLQIFHCELRDGLAFQDVNAIANNKRLHKLILTGVVGMDLSLMLPINLITLELKDSMLKDEDPIMVLGTLAHLRLLRLSNFFTGATLACKAGSFRQLEELFLDNMQNLASWTLQNGAMPCLKELEIVSCPCLLELPQGLEFVTTLRRLEFFEMSVKFCENAVDRGWGEYAPESYHERKWKQKRRSYPYEDDKGKYFIGLEEEIKNLVKLLMGEVKSQAHVLSIAGMGGSGKTTLARKLYNHPTVKECFNCRAWVFVSQEWSTRNIISQILRKIRGPKETIKLQARLSVEELIDRLHIILKDKSYLIVLDDIWTGAALEEILMALPTERGSKIIITTRNRLVTQLPSLQRNVYIHEPQPLNDEDGRELLRMIMLNHQMDRYEKFENIFGIEMLKKCDGLPLAIVALAEILSNRSIKEWWQINENVQLKVIEHTCTSMYSSVQDLLALSYDDLPKAFIPCFLYLSLFPEECKIPVGMLTRMWMAEDLLSTQEELSPEDVVKELSDRFMIKVVRTNFKGDIKAIQLHYLLHEFCVAKAKEVGFLQNCTPPNNLVFRDASTVTISCWAAHHSSLTIPTQAPNISSLNFLTRCSSFNSTYFPTEILDLGMMLNNFKQLRLLNLRGINTTTGSLPTEIGSLIHLRYLGIRASIIGELPSSIGNLKNLITLDYKNTKHCHDDKPLKIPTDIFEKLVLLKHLFLPIEYCWSVEKLQLSAMKELRILWGLRCDGGGDWFQTEMPKLSTTLKKLQVIVSTEKDLNAAFNYLSLMLNQLHSFHCEWYTGVALRDVNPMSHNLCLHKLVLVGPIQVELSVILPSNLVKLELKDSMLENEDPMVTIGELAHLKFLKLSKSYLGTVLICKKKSFPVLEELCLENLQSLNTWIIETGAMLCLSKLVIMKCGKLDKFPQGLPFMATLQHLEFFGLPQEFLQKMATTSDQRIKWPHNVEAILREYVSPFDISFIRKLSEQLTAGVFLNDKKQKYWLMKHNEHYYNCFMLNATYLSLWNSEFVDDIRFDYPLEYKKSLDCCWKWNQMRESTGASIMVGKIESSDSRCTLFDVRGKFNTKYLSLGVTYEIAYVVMIPQAAPIKDYGYTLCHLDPPNDFQLSRLRRHSRSVQRHKLNDKPRDKWIRLFAGRIKTTSADIGKITISLDRVCHGCVIKGVVIEPIF